MYKYDFAISFAGEQRKVAESIALRLMDHGIRVFYDKFELHELWGEDLAEKLHKVYSEDSQYCIILISKNYVDKMWTIHERKSALQKQIEQKGGYILPIKIENVSLPGLSDNIGYINFSDLSLDEIVDLVLLKQGLPTTDLLKEDEHSSEFERKEIDEISDKRTDRHNKLSNAWFPQKGKLPFYQIECISNEILNIKASTFKNTFLDLSKLYSETLNYAREPETHYHGYTRKLIYPNPDTLIEAVTCYNDGLVITEGHIEGSQFNPNHFIYKIQRHLQLSKEIMDEYLSKVNLQIKLFNLNRVVWEIYRGSQPYKTFEYCGYHDHIVLPVDIDEIHGRDKWNVKMDLAEFALLKIARMFGMDRLPQYYWDKDNILGFAKYSGR